MNEPPPHFADIRPDLDWPHALESVVLKALSKEPADRFQTMGEFKDVLLSSLTKDGDAPPMHRITRGQAIVANRSTAPVPQKPLSAAEPTAARRHAFKEKPNVLGSNAAQAGQSTATTILLASAIAMSSVGACAGVWLWGTSQSGLISAPCELLSFDKAKRQAGLYDINANKKITLELSDLAMRQLKELGQMHPSSILGWRLAAEISTKQNMLQSLKTESQDTRAARACQQIGELLESACRADEHTKPQLKDLGLDQEFARNRPLQVRESALFDSADTLRSRPSTALQLASLNINQPGILILAQKTAYLHKAKSGTYWQFQVKDAQIQRLPDVTAQ